MSLEREGDQIGVDSIELPYYATYSKQPRGGRVILPPEYQIQFTPPLPWEKQKELGEHNSDVRITATNKAKPRSVDVDLEEDVGAYATYVSWIRKRDLHVLTSNLISFTTDARFNVIHPQDSDDWNLSITPVTKRDAGVYECQVNTEPKINMAILLNVEDREMISEHGIQSTRSTKEAQATITGPEFVRTSSTISLTCSVNIHSQPAGSVTWYHGQNIVDFNSPRGGISMETTKSEQGTISKLVITKASHADAGNYTCVPSNAGPASVLVHVVNGEHTQPIHHVEHSGGVILKSSWLYFGISLLDVLVNYFYSFRSL